MPRSVTKRPHPLLHCRWFRPSQRHLCHQPLYPQPYKQIQPDRLLHQSQQVMPVWMQKIGQQGVGRPTPLASHPLYLSIVLLLARLDRTLVSPPPDHFSPRLTRWAALRHWYRSARTYLCFRVFFDCLCKLYYDQCPMAGTPPPAAEPSTLCAVRGGVPLFSRLASHYLFIFLSVKLVLRCFLSLTKGVAEGSPFNLTRYSQSNSAALIFSRLLSENLLFIPK